MVPRLLAKIKIERVTGLIVGAGGAAYITILSDACAHLRQVKNIK